MEKKFVLFLLIIAFLLCNCVAYLDEGIRTFDYLKSPGDWVALVIYTKLFSILPFVIFFLSKGKERKRFYFAFLGFIPVLLLIDTMNFN